jgi:putative spermidine/putrescine transport system permease protein
MPRFVTAGKAFLAAWLPALPLLALALVMLALPTAMVVLSSVHGDTAGWTLQFWAETMQRRGDRQAIVTSLSLGVACATLSLLIGAPLAWSISRSAAPARASWLSLLNVGANFGGIPLAFSFTASLGTYGMITLLVQQAGIGFSPPAPASFLGLLLAYLYTNIPLFVLLTLPAMAIVQRDMVEAAAVLGATTWETARFIGLPLLAPFLAAGCSSSPGRSASMPSPTPSPATPSTARSG